MGRIRVRLAPSQGRRRFGCHIASATAESIVLTFKGFGRTKERIQRIIRELRPGNDVRLAAAAVELSVAGAEIRCVDARYLRWAMRLPLRPRTELRRMG